MMFESMKYKEIQHSIPFYLLQVHLHALIGQQGLHNIFDNF